MAGNWAQSFFGGLAGELKDQNDRSAKLRDQKELEQFKKDEDYRNMVMKSRMDEEREKALQDHKNVLDKQTEVDKTHQKALDVANTNRSLSGDIKRYTSSVQNLDMDSQVSGAMPQSAAGTDPNAIFNPNNTPSQGYVNQTAMQNGTGLTASGAAPGTEGQAVPMQTPMPQTASTTQHVAQGQSPDAAHVQDENTNNSSTNTTSVGLTTPLSFADRALSASGINLPPEHQAQIRVATSAKDALSQEDFNTYATLLSAKHDKEANEFLKGNPAVRAWNIANNRTADGTDIDGAYTNTHHPLYDKENSVFMHAGSTKTYDSWVNRTAKNTDKMDLDNRLSQQQAKIQTDALSLSTIGRASEGALSSTNAEIQKFLNSDVSAQNALADHINALTNQNTLNNTKNLRSKYEYQSLQDQLPKLGTTPEGRLAIAQNTTAIEAGNVQQLKALQAYRDANGHTEGAGDLADRYARDVNGGTVFSPAMINTGIDPLHPDKWLNINARSFDNWKAIYIDKTASPGPNGSTINNITKEVMPDELKETLLNIYKSTLVQKNTTREQNIAKQPATQNNAKNILDSMGF